jgi:hypothetical protein
VKKLVDISALQHFSQPLRGETLPEQRHVTRLPGVGIARIGTQE